MKRGAQRDVEFGERLAAPISSASSKNSTIAPAESTNATIATMPGSAQSSACR